MMLNKLLFTTLVAAICILPGPARIVPLAWGGQGTVVASVNHNGDPASNQNENSSTEAPVQHTGPSGNGGGMTDTVLIDVCVGLGVLFLLWLMMHLLFRYGGCGNY